MKCSTQHLTKVFSPCVKKVVVTEVQFFDDVVTLGDNRKRSRAIRYDSHLILHERYNTVQSD